MEGRLESGKIYRVFHDFGEFVDFARGTWRGALRVWDAGRHDLRAWPFEVRIADLAPRNDSADAPNLDARGVFAAFVLRASSYPLGEMPYSFALTTPIGTGPAAGPAEIRFDFALAGDLRPLRLAPLRPQAEKLRRERAALKPGLAQGVAFDADTLQIEAAAGQDGAVSGQITALDRDELYWTLYRSHNGGYKHIMLQGKTLRRK